MSVQPDELLKFVHRWRQSSFALFKNDQEIVMARKGSLFFFFARYTDTSDMNAQRYGVQFTRALACAPVSSVRNWIKSWKTHLLSPPEWQETICDLQYSNKGRTATSQPDLGFDYF